MSINLIELTNTLPECSRTSFGGVQELYFGRRSEFGHWTYGETALYQQGVITGNTNVGGNIYLLTPNIQSVLFTENHNLGEVRDFTKTLNFNYLKQDVYNRDRFEQFLLLDDLFFIYRDSNNLYWLVGEEYGTDITLETTTGTFDEINQYELTITANERQMTKTVLPEFVESLVGEVPLEALCSEDWSALCSAEWSELCSQDWS